MGAIVLLECDVCDGQLLETLRDRLLENTSDEKLNEVEERSLSVGGYAIAQTINSVKTTNKVVIMSVLDKHLDFLRNDALIHDDSQSKLALNTNEPSVDSTM
ncbi:hypothetical protein [Nostoc sp. GT001]|uniref:hypothetical protein n=1 Tax=Nostoc sp. GT001 TaxID=3056647 RepID=UPI0025AAE4BB|nr:hypothetical protein [Nostoc sp. GT001]MDM9580162.1 hypothetical protein [Nostoc sp. GT001]